MRWLFRKQRRQTEDDTEDLEFKEPKKSILRTSERKQQPWQEVNGNRPMTDFSLVDLRNATVSGGRYRDTNIHSDRMPSKVHSSQSLRSLDSGRDSERVKRNVLFLDEVLQRKKQLNNSVQSIGSPAPLSPRTTTPFGTPFSTFASYPASYQPSPVVQKRDMDSGIELISRSPLPRAKLMSEDGSDIWSPGSPNKEIFRNLSLSRGRGRQRQRYEQKSVSSDSAYEMSDGLDAINGKGVNQVAQPRFSSGWGTVAGFASRSIIPSNGPPVQENDRDTGSKVMNGTTAKRSSTFEALSSPANSVPEPMVRRPVYPRLIEPRILKPANSDNHTDRINQPHVSIHKATDSNVTLRPDRASSGSLDTLIDLSRRPTPTSLGVQGQESLGVRVGGRSTPASPQPQSKRQIQAKQSSIHTYRTIPVSVPAPAPLYRTIEVPPARKSLAEKPPQAPRSAGPLSSTPQHTVTSRVIVSSKPPHILTVSTPVSRSGSAWTQKTPTTPQLNRVISINRPVR